MKIRTKNFQREQQGPTRREIVDLLLTASGAVREYARAIDTQLYRVSNWYANREKATDALADKLENVASELEEKP